MNPQQKSVAPLDISRYSNIVVLTGAGVSAASGLQTFRDSDGNLNPLLPPDWAWASDARNLPESLNRLWQIYGPLRELSTQVEPNAAHFALSKLQDKWSENRSITLVTQNVDELHQRSGSLDVVELHGSLLRSKCTNWECISEAFGDHTPRDSAPPCEVCGSPLRPDIVLFNEALPLVASTRVKRALRDCDLFLAIGTSGTVSPASEFVRGAAYVGAETVLVNLAPTPHASGFKREIIGRAEEVLPLLLDV